MQIGAYELRHALQVPFSQYGFVESTVAHVLVVQVLLLAQYLRVAAVGQVALDALVQATQAPLLQTLLLPVQTEEVNVPLLHVSTVFDVVVSHLVLVPVHATH